MGVDSRIVTMKFDNAQFQTGAAETLSTLEKLKSSMNFSSVGTAATTGLGLISTGLSKLGLSNPFAKLGESVSGFASKFSVFSRFNPFAKAQTGVADLQGATNSFSVGSMTGAVTGVSKTFIAMSTIAITALSNIVTSAMEAGKNLASALTIDPIKTGLDEYELNLNSIQTILANTKISGADLGDVNKALDELNRYSDQTIYNFAEMAKNIGTFTAAGVDLDTSVSSIKGIANLAALSGSNAQQAATAMYQLSQEISAGRVSLMGWNSVVNAGMGGSAFQRALAQTAVAMGEIPESAVKLEGSMKNVKIQGQSFRDSIMAKPGEQSWLSKEVLLGTLKQFTGDMTDAELAAQGFDKAQIKAIKEMAKTALDAATKVKTLTQLIDVAKETAQSGWKDTWQFIFGDFKEARTMFTNASDTVNGYINASADARNKVLGDWKELGGRTVLLDAVKNAFYALIDILTPVKQAFRDIFPAKTGEDLYNLTVRLRDFTESLSISDSTSEKLRRTFAGVFAIFSILGQVIGAVAGMFGQLFGAVSAGSGDFLGFTGGLGDGIVAFDQWLEKSGVLTGFFGGLGNILSVPIRLLASFSRLISGLFGGFDTGAADKMAGAVGDVGDKLKPLEGIGDRVDAVFSKIGDVLSGAWDIIVDALSGIGDAISGAITPETFSASLDAINTALFGALVLMIKKFFSQGVSVDLSGGLFDNIKKTLGAATSALTNMQASIKADIILKIAIALAVLTASLFVLSTIDPKKLGKALITMGIGFAALQVAMVKLTTALAIFGVFKILAVAAALVMFSSAILILSVALKIMESMDLGDMLRGLMGMGIMLWILTKALIPLSANAGGMIRASAALILLGIAMNLLAVSLKIFASMSWEEMARGLIGLAGALLIFAGAMRLMPKGMLLQAASIMILSVAMNALAVALKIFASMTWTEMAKGLVALAGALVVIAAAMWLMPPGPMLLIQAAALAVLGVALTIIAGAIMAMGGMSWEEIAKGLVALGGALLVLAAGLFLMSGALMGAIALTVAAAALAILTPVLIMLGNLSWATIIKGLVALAGIFLVLGAAGLVLAPLVPVLLGLGVALILIGAGLALAGAGALAFATAFGVVVATGSAGVRVMGQMLGTIIKAIPKAMAAFGQGIVKFAQAIAKGGPAFVRAMGKIISNMLDAIIKNVPKMAKAFMVMLTAALRVVVTMTPKIVAAGFKLIISFLQAISRNIGKITNIAADIIVKFLNGIARNIGKIIQSGVNLIIRFINGVSTAIENNSNKMGEAGGRLAVAMVRGIASGISGATGVIKDAAISAAKSALDAAMDFIKPGSPSKLFRDEIGAPIARGMAQGIGQEAYLVARESKAMGKTALKSLKSTMEGVSDALSLNADMNPTISPVLDLTQLTREANKMSAILAAQPVMADVSYRAALEIAAEADANRQAVADASSEDRVRDVTFEQNNYSPKSIGAVEVYRQTRNQLALAKEALTK